MTPAGNPAADDKRIEALLAALPDPEIPVLTLGDLGVIRWVRETVDGVTVGIAPTYTGCPATEFIAETVQRTLQREGFDNVRTEQVLEPAWTTDWISDEGRRKLHDYGIVPPAHAASKRALVGDHPVACPRCGDEDTTCVSEFGSTPCKASYKCNACLEPFELFKCL